MANRLAAGASLATLLMTMPPCALAAQSNDPPTQSQIRAAVNRATRSRRLWATVNICDTPSHRYMIGIRGQMPALGFTTSLWMDIGVQYWNGKRFEADPYVGKMVDLGSAVGGVHQSGVTFQFRPRLLLRGAVRFEWKLAGDIVGRFTTVTSGGHSTVDGGDPPRYSRATCLIK